MAKKKYKTLIMIFTSEMICEGAVSAKWARDPFTPCQPEVIPLPFFEWKDGTKTDNGICIQTMPTRNYFTFSMERKSDT